MEQVVLLAHLARWTELAGELRGRVALAESLAARIDGLASEARAGACGPAESVERAQQLAAELTDLADAIEDMANRACDAAESLSDEIR